MSTERTPRTDKELWQSLAADRNVAPGAVSDLDLAAWLDGRLPEAAAARIDAAVAADPDLRRASFDLADVLGKPLPAAPARMAVRAQALVGFEAERRSGQASGFLGRLVSSGTRYALQRTAMATMAIVIAGAGFIVGGGLGESFAQQRYGSDVTRTASETSNELTDFSDGI
jgi:anti-sigma factor RsiW